MEVLKSRQKEKRETLEAVKKYRKGGWAGDLDSIPCNVV